MYQVEPQYFLSRLSVHNEMAQRIQDFDWSQTTLGPIQNWPLSLQNAVTLMLSSGQPMLISWGEDFIQLYNDAYRPLLGHAGLHPRSLGESARETWPEAWPQIAPMWKQVKETGHFFNGENVRFLLKRNGYFEETFFSLSIAPLYNDDMVSEGLLITCFETTEKIKEELKLKERLTQFQYEIEEYQKGVLLRDEFISIASHELKSPLTALKLQTQMQKQLVLRKDPRGFDKERIKHFSEIVDDQVGRLNRIVDDILEIGRIRRGKLTLMKEEVELGRLVRESIEGIRTQFNSTNFPVIETKEQIKGFWDADKLKQVVVNILLNAIQFGELNPILIKVEKEKNSAKLTIKDNGIGIPKENLDKIFEKYERVGPKEKSEARNGLFLTKKIVDAHDGKISVVSKLGEGSTFFVQLPL